MTIGRSRFGTLLRRHRLELGLSQENLALRIAAIASDQGGKHGGMLTEKAISNLEAAREPGKQVTPRISTVRILARALELEKRATEYDDFLDAASHNGHEPHTVADEIGAFATDGIVEPLVTAGREVELERLSGHFKDALKGRPQIVFVAGDSGIGKTFLINHFCQRAVSSNPNLVAAISSADSPGGLGEPYQLFKQVMALLAGDISMARADQLLSQDHTTRMRLLTVPAAETLITYGPGLVGPFIDAANLQRRVHSVALDDAWWLPVLDRLATESGSRTTNSPDQLHEQTTRFLLEMAKHHPLILVLDDLHWTDDRSCDLLFYLVRRLHRLRGVPLLIVGAYRLADLAVRGPSARHPLHPVINETRRYWGEVVIDLTNTIGDENGRLFIDAVIDVAPNHLDGSFRSLLYDRTEGHPLFVTELRQWLRDREILVQDENGFWTTSRAVTFDELPGRISAVVAERIGRLPPELQKTLRVASTQGLSFIAEVVGRVRQLSRRRLAGQLEAVVSEHRLLVADTSPGMEVGEHRYRFVHSLFQEYLSGSVGSLTRQSLHLETAKAIVAVVGDPGDHALDIARHFELGGDPASAAHWFVKTGDRSLREFDHDSALRWFGHALDLVKDLDDQELCCRASIGLSEAHRARGDVTAAIQVGLKALEASAMTHNPVLRAECLTSLGVVFYDIGNHEQAESYLQEALTLLPQDSQSSDATACAAHYLLSYTLYARGAYSEGVDHARQALALARRSGLKRKAGESLISVAYYHVDLGDYATALALYADAQECQQGADDLRGRAVSLLNIGLCHIELKQFERAAESLDEALRLAERIRLPRTKAFAMTYFGLLYEGLNRWSEAVERFKAAYEQRLSTGQEPLAIDALAGSVRVAIATGDLTAARRDTEAILDWLATRGADGIEYPIRVYLTLVHALRALDDAVRADQALADGQALLIARAERIADPGLRRSFLEQVPFNRALMALAPSVSRLPAKKSKSASLD